MFEWTRPQQLVCFRQAGNARVTRLYFNSQGNKVSSRGLLVNSSENNWVFMNKWLVKLHLKTNSVTINLSLAGSLVLGGSKITSDVGSSHESKRHLLLGRKALRNLETILKSKDITLPTKVYLVKPVVFPVVMYGCNIQTVKKAECQRIDAFEVWYRRRLLTVPWTARRSNQSILKKINPGISLEGMMLKLKLQYFGHLM